MKFYLLKNDISLKGGKMDILALIEGHLMVLAFFNRKYCIWNLEKILK